MTWKHRGQKQLSADKGICFGQATLGDGGTIDRIEITLPDRYDETQTSRAEIQSASTTEPAPFSNFDASAY